MTQNIDRRSFLTAAAGGLVVISLGGCTSDTVDGKKRPHYVMVFDQNKCVGCGECKEACAETNKTPAGVFRLALERQNGREPGTACPYCGKIEPCDCERKYVRVSCQQCLDAPCVRVCPTQAAHRDPETNIVTMNTDRCVGCKYCIAACPYNARWINPETKVADNCDFCLHSKNLAAGELPGCVAHCRFHALSFGDLNDPNSFVSKLLKAKGMRQIRYHDLRHSCASLLLANGVPMKQIQEWLGHSDFSTTANIYAHLDYSSKLTSADAMLNGLGFAQN